MNEILHQTEWSKQDIVRLLAAKGDEMQQLFAKAAEIKSRYVGNFVYFRGLIELSNICSKNCYYCGIRCGNKNAKRYILTESEVLEAVKYAYTNNFGSVVIQSGERSNKSFVDFVSHILKKITNLTNGGVGITLSLGEQSEETYRRWLENGATRYLLRIESSNRSLYNKIHPVDELHDYDKRLEALKTLQKTGYQTGTGVMIGLPFQTLGDLAGDLLFMKKFDIDMVGMGPYIEHEQTPLYQYQKQLMPIKERFDLTLKMIAILRIIMKDVNIAAVTALQAIDPYGRETSLRAGANVIMPNLTPTKYHGDYSLYKNKPLVNEKTDAYIADLEAHIKAAGDEVAYGKKGDPKHFYVRRKE